MRHALQGLTMLTLLLVVGVSLRAAGDSAESSHGRALTISGGLMSPFCPGRLLSECQSQGAFDLREEIAMRLDRGESPEAIVDDLAQRYGEGIRGAPALEGFGLLAWTMPLLLAGGTLAVLVIGMRRTTRCRGAAAAPLRDGVDSDDSTVAARLDEELRALD